MKKKETNIDVSVIIPMYNVEAYLPACIESVLKQNGTIEIILIDDGSTDQTLETAKEYEKKRDNIRLVKQAHSGVSIARNQGLTIARGEYITFIDSDDWISPYSLSNLYEEAKKQQVDMILGKIDYCYSDGKQDGIYDHIPIELKNKVMSGAECFINLMRSGYYHPKADVVYPYYTKM